MKSQYKASVSRQEKDAMHERVLFSTKTFFFVALVVATYIGCVILFLCLPSLSLPNILGLLIGVWSNWFKK